MTPQIRISALGGIVSLSVRRKENGMRVTTMATWTPSEARNLAWELITAADRAEEQADVICRQEKE